MAKLVIYFALMSLAVSGSFAVDSLRFLIIGDMGGLPIFPYFTPVEVGTAAQMAKFAKHFGTKFILELGDNFYYNGVRDVDDLRFRETFEGVYTQNSLQIPWYLVAGNHDHLGNVSAQIAYTKRSKRWNFPNYYYPLSFKIPNSNSTIDIIMIDTITLCGNVLDDFHGHQPKGPIDKNFANAQWKWIEQMLASSKSTYLLTAGHYPVYSIAEHGPTECLVDQLLPMLYKYRANGHISGHDHNMQHLQTAKDGVTLDYIVSGSANFIDDSLAHQKFVPPGSSKFHWADKKTLGGFVYAEATPNNLTASFIDSRGKVLYQSVIFPRKL